MRYAIILVLAVCFGLASASRSNAQWGGSRGPVRVGGGCGPNGCPTQPSFSGGFSGGYQPAPVAFDGAVLPGTILSPYWVEYKGLKVRVFGELQPDGLVTWDTSLNCNATAIRQAAAAKRAEQAKAVVDVPAEEERPVKVKVRIEGPEPTKTEPPTTTPPPTAPQNFGLSPDKMGLHKAEEYTAGSEEAKRFVEAAKSTEVGDLTGKLHLTVIGSEQECADVIRNVKSHPAFSEVRDKLLVQEYRPTEWAVDPKHGFQVQGKPTILVQTAANGGRVLFRSMDYSIGPDGLAQAIRKSDPHYNPANDPGPERRGPGGGCPFGFTHAHWPAICVVGLVLSFIVFNPRRNSGGP